MSASVSSRRGALGLVYIPELNEPQRAVHAQSEVVAGVVVDDLPVCRAGCGHRMLKRAKFRSLPKEDQARLRALKVRRVEARGVCGGCYSTALKSGLIAELQKTELPENAAVYKSFDVPALWQSVRDAGGGYLQLAEEMGGVTREYARQVVIKLRLPRADVRYEASREREYFLGELDHLHRCGVGVHGIARAFSMTEDELIRKVTRLRDRGLTEIRFDSYLEVAA